MDLNKLIEAHKNNEFNFIPKPQVYDSHVQATVVNSSDKVVCKTRIYKGPCHAAVRGGLRDDSIAVVNACADYTATLKGAEKFYHWLLNDSDFASSFIVKDAKLSITNGFVQSVDTHPAIFLGAAQLCRLPASEFKDNFKAICAIIDAEPDIDIAKLTLLALAHGWILSEDRKLIETSNNGASTSLANNQIYVGNSSHLPYNSITSDEALEFFSNMNKRVANHLKPDQTLRIRRGWDYNCSSYTTGNIKGNSNIKIRELLQNVYCTAPSPLFKEVKKAVENKEFVYEDIFKKGTIKVVIQNSNLKNRLANSIKVNFRAMVA